MNVYRQAADAYRAGHAAAQAGGPRRNPYDGNAATALERVLSQMWARGYSRGNRMNAL
ncbi:MAG: hypothetical protein L0H84_24605 [Pseudonocardia sp.]|nr:hypothetical protein [Pseudonocardia sp.]